MEFSQIIQNRQSIRKFTNQPVEAEKLEKIIDALLKAPSSKANFPCQFFFVKDSTIITKLSDCKPHGAAFLKNSPLVVVIAADPQVSDVWVEDASIAATYIMLEAVNEGLAGCWVQVRKRDYSEELSSSDYIKDILNLDTGLEVLALYGVGYPNEKPADGNYVNYSPVSIIG